MAGEPLVRSRLELCALDLETKRIRKAATVGVTEDMRSGEPLPELGFSRFPKEEYPAVETVTVRSTNLDYCSHTNNVEYVRFILNTYSAEALREREIERIEMHYGSQSFEGDRLHVGKVPSESGDFFSIRADGRSIADGVIVFRAADPKRRPA